MCFDILNRLGMAQECDGRTDRRIDRQADRQTDRTTFSNRAV